ncbi:hypothetical protein [Nocardiopsis kunsanensis]|nr:hypothetical protein [Nocardiopsis kunsanensis]
MNAMDRNWPSHVGGPIKEFEMTILREYEREGFDHASLPRIARQTMEDAPSIFDIDPAEVLEVAVTSGLPRQDWSNDFGEPVLTVANNRHFRVDLLFWAHNASPTHSHVSCGAFAPVYGRRVHQTYSFHQHEEEEKGFRLGTLSALKRDTLATGEAVEITPELIHDLYWLKQPSVTLSLRCHNHPALGSEQRLRPWEFWETGVAVVDMVHQDSANVNRQMSSLRLLQQVAPKRFRRTLKEVAAGGEALLVYHLAADIAGTNWGVDYYDDFLNALDLRSDSSGQAISALLPVLHRKSLYNQIRSHNEATQFAVGLLWNGTPVERIDDFLATSYPQTEVQKALQALDEITGPADD